MDLTMLCQFVLCSFCLNSVLTTLYFLSICLFAHLLNRPIIDTSVQLFLIEILCSLSLSSPALFFSQKTEDCVNWVKVIVDQDEETDSEIIVGNLQVPSSKGWKLNNFYIHAVLYLAFCHKSINMLLPICIEHLSDKQENSIGLFD